MPVASWSKFMMSADMLARVAKAANELRRLQAEMGSSAEDRRAVEYSRLLDEHLASFPTFEQKKAFLAELDERFPVLQVHAQRLATRESKDAVAGELDATRQRLAKLEAELADPFRLVARLAEHWSRIPEAKKREMLDLLATRGPVPLQLPASPAPSTSASADTAGPRGAVDDEAARDLIGWIATGEPKPPSAGAPGYAQVVAVLLTLLDYVKDLDKTSLAAIATLDVEAGSVRLPRPDDLRLAIRDFVRESNAKGWREVRAKCRTTVVLRYLSEKSKQWNLQFMLAANMKQALHEHLSARFAPAEVEREVEQLMAKSSTLGFIKTMSWDKALKEALERRLGIGKGEGKEDDVREVVERLAGKMLREGLRRDAE